MPKNSTGSRKPTAYNHFIREMYGPVKLELVSDPNIQGVENRVVMRTLGARWTMLDLESKQKYIDMCKGDNEQKKVKNQNSYMMYVNDMRPTVLLEITTENNGVSPDVTIVSKRLGELWRQLPEEEKEVYKQRAAEVRKQYKDQEAATGSVAPKKIKPKKPELPFDITSLDMALVHDERGKDSYSVAQLRQICHCLNKSSAGNKEDLVRKIREAYDNGDVAKALSGEIRPRQRREKKSAVAAAPSPAPVPSPLPLAVPQAVPKPVVVPKQPVVTPTAVPLASTSVPTPVQPKVPLKISKPVLKVGGAK